MARSVISRRSHQCAGRSWHPRRRSQIHLIHAIVQSIDAAAARGEVRTPAQYTPHPETQAAVVAALAQGR